VVIIVALAFLLGQEPGADQAKFAALAAEFDARERTLQLAASESSRAVAVIDWIRALFPLLDLISNLPPTGPHISWVKAREAQLAYDEIGGRWRIDDRVLDEAYKRHAKSAVADEIAWMIVKNGLSGECEGYVPCYAAGLDMLYGEYLRRHPRGAHRDEAFERISETLRIVLDDLLKRKDRDDFLSVPKDCVDLRQAALPLRAAIDGAAGGTVSEAWVLSNRLIGVCGPR
jgi:hypothetical protein